MTPRLRRCVMLPITEPQVSGVSGITETCHSTSDYSRIRKLPVSFASEPASQLFKTAAISGLSRIKMLPVVGHVHGLRETLRLRAATANVALTLMKYTHAYII